MTNKKLILGMLLAFTITSLSFGTQEASANMSGACDGSNPAHTRHPPVLTATVIDFDTVQLNWTQAMCGHPLASITSRFPTSYDVEQTFTIPVNPFNPPYSAINVGNVFTYNVEGLTPNTNYCFEVQGNWATFPSVTLYDSLPICITTDSLPDTTQPVITLLGDNPQFINLTNPYIEQGATALDDIDGDRTPFIITDFSAVNTSIHGSYIVTYDVNDTAGNDATQQTRTVIVLDNIIPVIALNGDSEITVPYASTYVDEGATAFDIDDGNLTSSIVVVNPVDTLQPLGTFFITYDVSDSTGNVATQVIRTVKITSSPSGHSCTNCQRPSIGVTETGLRVVDGGITVNGITSDADFYFTPFPLVTVQMGEPVTMQFVIWDDRADNISYVSLELGKVKIGESFGTSDNKLIWSKNLMNQQTSIDFDQKSFTDVQMRMLGKTSCREPSNGYTCDFFEVQFTPIQAIVGDVVFGIEIRDNNHNAMTTFFNEGLQVGTESDVIPITEFVAPEGTGNKSTDPTEDRSCETTSKGFDRNCPEYTMMKQGQELIAKQLADSLGY